MDKEIVKEKLQKKLEQIDEKLNLKRVEIRNSKEYKLLEKTKDNLGIERRKKEQELRQLEKPIYNKYIKGYYMGWRGLEFKPKDIKSSVKQGIKKGLGIKNVLFIGEYNIKKIVMKLIEKDLEKVKPQIDKLKIEIKGFGRQFDICYNKDDELFIKGLDSLTKQRKKIVNKLNEKEILKNKRIEENRKIVDIKIEKNLSKFMNKITKEVDKRLILEGLK